jgi:hypothetical protein
MAGVGERAEPHAWRSMCGCALNASPAASPARSASLAKPAVANGAPRSDVNTNGDSAPSRCSLRSARSSSPRIRWSTPKELWSIAISMMVRTARTFQISRRLASGSPEHYPRRALTTAIMIPTKIPTVIRPSRRFPLCRSQIVSFDPHARPRRSRCVTMGLTN